VAKRRTAGTVTQDTVQLSQTGRTGGRIRTRNLRKWAGG
jgi:hypothetical protein